MDAGIDSELVCSRLLKSSKFYTPDPQTYCSNKYLKKKKKKICMNYMYNTHKNTTCITYVPHM